MMKMKIADTGNEVHTLYYEQKILTVHFNELLKQTRKLKGTRPSLILSSV